MDLAVVDGAVTAIGLSAHACAIGQAAAAIFASHASGRSKAEIANSLRDLEAWLSGAAALPAWPMLDQIAAARDFPGRHGAMLLPWKAALDALSSEAMPG